MGKGATGKRLFAVIISNLTNRASNLAAEASKRTFYKVAITKDFLLGGNQGFNVSVKYFKRAIKKFLYNTGHSKRQALILTPSPGGCRKHFHNRLRGFFLPRKF